jgi:hypothetical protein
LAAPESPHRGRTRRQADIQQERPVQRLPPFALLIGSIIAISVAAAVPASAQSSPPGITPVRGTVASVSDGELTVNSQSGAVKIHLGNPLTVYGRTSSDLAHVTPKSFVGITSVKQPDGSERATEIHIFPDALRGVGEGSYMMNPDPAKATSAGRMTNGTVSGSTSASGSPSKSRMTNGTVTTLAEGSTLSVQYGGGMQTIVVPPDVHVSALAPTRDKLTPGQDVVALTKKQSDGSVTTTAIIAISPAAQR